MSENHIASLIGGLAITAIVGLVVSAPAVHADDFAAPDRAPTQWLDRILPADRGPLEDWIGYLPPSFDESLTWITPSGQEGPDAWLKFQGKVVVIQSWSSENEASRTRLQAIEDVITTYSPIDVQLISLHIPDGADSAAEHINADELDVRHMAAIDSKGHFSDLLGVYRTPVNLVIGRSGAVRYAGLSPIGLGAALEALLDEDPFVAPCGETRPIPSGDSAEARGPAVAFPAPSNDNIRATDLRGRRAPDFAIGEWITPEPSGIGSRVTMIEFWRTGCPHCINAIPAKNNLARQFRDRLDIVAITGESRAALQQGLQRRNIELSNIEYNIAIDPRNALANVFRPQGVPNAAVIDSNWIVRWQGHPGQLNATLLEQIIRADESQRGPAPIVKRWHPDPDQLVERPQRPFRERGIPVTEWDRMTPEERIQAADARRARAGEATPDRQQARTREAPRGRTDGFPPAVGDVRAAVDLRGERGPDLQVEQWINDEPDSLEGKITIVEFFATWCPHCRNIIPKMNDIAERYSDDVTIIAITDEDINRFNENLTRHRLPKDAWKHPVAIDSTNRMKHAFRPRGVPSALVLDSNWIVRWQGHPGSLNDTVIEQIIRADTAARAQGGTPESGKTATAPDVPGGLHRISGERPRPEPRPERQQRTDFVRGQGPAEFPPITGDVRAAIDLRGKPGPPFYVQSWITDVPKDMDDPIVIVEFFATWCPHCRNTIPKLNEFAEQFKDEVSIIVISNEQRDAFLRGAQQHNLTPESWKFAVAVDPSDRMKNAIRPQGVPSALVLGSDWTVRWQGHPAGLTASVIDQIIRADQARRQEEGPTDRTVAAPPEPETPAEVPQARVDRGPVDFPPTTPDTASANDLQGQPGPEFHVDRWITARPMTMGDRVTVVEFFATWCPHCRNAIPKMNEWSVRFRDRVNIIAISDEDSLGFQAGLEQHNLTRRSFNHFVALDPESTMKNAFGPRGVPFVVVYDSNGIVRWQGHPNNLDIEVLDQIVRADESSRVRASR